MCRGWLVSRIESRWLRALLCVAVVGVTAFHYFGSPFAKNHGSTWKYALQLVQKNASSDNAPVLICSDLPESNVMKMPEGDAAKDSALFAPLSYYRLSVPVVGLPRALNTESVRIGSQFLRETTPRHRRFLAVASTNSLETLDWLKRNASDTFDCRSLMQTNEIVALEFTSRK